MNPSAPVDWVSGSIILIAGLVAGAFLIWRFVGFGKAQSRDAQQRVRHPEPEDAQQRIRHSVRSENTLELKDLEAKRDALILQLQEFEDTAPKGDVGQLARERYHAELEAAEVLRQIDQLRPAASTASDALSAEEAESALPATGFLAHRPALRGFVYGALSVAMVAGLGLLVWKYAAQRQPGASATGAPQGMGVAQQQPSQQPDAELIALQQAVTNNPNDINTHLDLAQGYLVREQLMPVFEQTQFVLDRDPENVRALTYQAFVRMAMGQMDQAREMLAKATTKQPDFVDAWVQTALLNTLTGRPKEAEQAIEEAAKRRPEEAQNLRNLLSQMRAHENAEPQQAQASPVPPMAGQGAPAAAAAADPAKSVTGMIELGVPTAPGSVLFLSARPEGVAGGPPLAAERLDATSFPMQFSIGQANSMMGQELPPKVRIEARLDADGDAMTRGPQDLVAVADGVALGTSQVRLVLK